MDKRDALKIANQYLDLISNKYTVLQAYMFGSFAKGTNHEDSDIDLAIIIKNANDIIDIQIDMMKLRRKIDLRIEPHPFMIGDFTNDNPIVYEILKNGIQIRKFAA